MPEACPVCGESSTVCPKLLLIDAKWTPAPRRDARIHFFSDISVDDLEPENVRYRPLEQFIDGFYCYRCDVGFVSEEALRQGWGQYRQS
jgi:hypothetical protein